MAPDDPRHGTRPGYDAHRRAGVPACPACTDAAARYERGRQWDLLRGHRRLLPDTGTRRRLQALIALGWTTTQLGEAIGMHRGNLFTLAARPQPGLVQAVTARKVAALYDRLCMTIPPASEYATKARNAATRRGWVPPLAWDDDTIDDPNARPRRGRSRDTGPLFDMAVVLRLVDDSTRVRKLSPAEAAKAFQLLRERGLSDRAIEKNYGLVAARYTKKEAS
jgi:hypothetical protein